MGWRRPFEYQDYGKQLATFSLAARALTPGPGAAGPRRSRHSVPGLGVQGWKSTTAPTLNGKTLKLQQYENSHSLAVAPGHHSLLVGTEMYLYCFARSGIQRWISLRRTRPGRSMSVGTAGSAWRLSGRTVHWYRMTDGQELFALFPHADQKRWVRGRPPDATTVRPAPKT